MLLSRLIYIALLIAAFIFSQALYDSISLFTLAVVILIPVVSLLCLLLSLALVKIEVLPFPTREARMKEFYLKVVIKSKTPLMLPVMKFFVTVNNADGDATTPGCAKVHYRAFGKTTLEIPVKFKVRGLYKVGIDAVVFSDFLGIFSIKKRLNSSNLVTITPRDLDDLKLPVHANRQEQENTLTSGGRETQTGDPSGIREFNETDTLRRVHWKLSSRLSKLIVKTYWENSCDNIMVITDLFPYEEDRLMNLRLTDCVVEIGLELSRMLAEKGVRLTLAYPTYESPLYQQTVSTVEEQMVAADQLFMNPMKDSGRIEQALHELDLSVLQGGALYVVTSMPSDDLKNCMETYLRGINCEREFIVVRPEEERVRHENMKVLALSDLEKGED